MRVGSGPVYCAAGALARAGRALSARCALSALRALSVGSRSSVIRLSNVTTGQSGHTNARSANNAQRADNAAKPQTTREAQLQSSHVPRLRLHPDRAGAGLRRMGAVRAVAVPAARAAGVLHRRLFSR